MKVNQTYLLLAALQGVCFVAAYNTELQLWVNAVKAGRVDGPSAWDG